MIEKIQLQGQYTLYRDINSLNDDDKAILVSAMQALELSYAPYSGFQVGASLLMDNGYMVQGANQENASYPLCICAERVALYNASIHYPGGVIKDLAVIARKVNGKVEVPVPPCGACRQVIAEYELRQNSPIRILLKSDAPGILVFQGIENLLPLAFNGKVL